MCVYAIQARYLYIHHYSRLIDQTVMAEHMMEGRGGGGGGGGGGLVIL